MSSDSYNQQQQQQDYFAPGALVECTSCLGQTLKGEVEAFERHKKLLILKSSLDSGKQLINLINLDLVKEVSIVKEASSIQQQIHTNSTLTDGHESHTVILGFNHTKVNKIQQRKQEAIDKKRRSIAPVKISPEGQHVFMAIRKAIEDVRWDQDSIVVSGKVLVTNPYRTGDVRYRTSARNQTAEMREKSECGVVKKIVERVWLEKLAPPPPPINSRNCIGTSAQQQQQEHSSSCPPTVTHQQTTVNCTMDELSSRSSRSASPEPKTVVVVPSLIVKNSSKSET